METLITFSNKTNPIRLVIEGNKNIMIELNEETFNFIKNRLEKTPTIETTKEYENNFDYFYLSEYKIRISNCNRKEESNEKILNKLNI